MSCFKDLILACAAPAHKRKQVAPKVSPSPPGPVFSRAPSAARKAPFVSEPVTPVKLSRTFSQFSGDKEGAHHLPRAASMGARTHRAAAFAASKTMSSKDMMRRSDSDTGTPRMQRSVSHSHQNQPIVFSTSSGLLRALQVEQMLECTLDELCFGCVKQIEVSRAVVTLTGSMSKEEELLTVNVNPGWKKGTTITFPGKEDKETGSHSADVVFVVVEKEHDRLKRQEGNEEDLEVVIGLPLVDAISGCNFSVPLLGGGQIFLFSDDIIEPGFERVLQGQGMPKKKHPTERGDLKIKFHVEFPNSLTAFQRSEIVQILSG